MKRVYGAGVSLLMVLASAVAAQAEGDRREILPDAVLPLHYDVQLSPDATALSFRGKVAITVTVTAPVNDITLNADGLTFDHASLDQTPHQGKSDSRDHSMGCWPENMICWK